MKPQVGQIQVASRLRKIGSDHKIFLRNEPIELCDIATNKPRALGGTRRTNPLADDIEEQVKQKTEQARKLAETATFARLAQ